MIVVEPLGPEVAGLPVTCQDTGVTQYSICGQLKFFVTGRSATMTTPGGAGLECVGSAGIFSSGSVTGTGSLTLEVTKQ